MNDQLFKTENNLILPLSFRWFAAQGLLSFSPWYIFDDLSKGNPIAAVFTAENIQRREILPVAHRQDCDDFAGFEIRGSVVQENVIYFHPAFNRKTNSEIIISEYENFWSFFREIVITDMEDWACEKNFKDMIKTV